VTLAAYILGLGAGPLLAGRRLSRPGAAPVVAAVALAGAGVSSLFLVPALGRLPIVAALVSGRMAHTPSVLIAAQFSVMAALLLVPTLCQGAAFPALAACAAGHPGEAHGAAGRLYAASSWGAVAGFTAAGFLALPLAGTRASLVAASVASMLLAIDESPENLHAARRWLLPPKIDTTICFTSVVVFTLCFVILGARILHPQQLVPADKELLSHQSQFLTDLHPLLLYVYQLGIFMAFFGTIYGAYEIYFRTAYECLMPISGWFRALEFETFRRSMLVYCAVLGLVFLWTMEDPVKIITPAALIGGVFTCGLWCLAMLWADRRFLPRTLQMPWLLWLATAVSGVVLTLLGLKGIWDYTAGLIAQWSAVIAPQSI